MIALFAAVLSSCIKEFNTTPDVEYNFVSLMERDDYSIFDKTVILFEGEKYLVKTPLFYFLTNLVYLNDLFTNYDSYLSILGKIVFDSQTDDLLHSSKYFGMNNNYLLACFLVNGFCYFYDKEKEDNVKQVEIKNYRTNRITETERKKFYINHTLFIETVGSFIEYKENDLIFGKNIEEKISVSLIDKNDDEIFRKAVILYEDDKYLIKTPLVYFLSNMDKQYFAHRYDEHLYSLKKVISDGKTNNLLYVSSYFDEYRIDYVLAGFLETGFCYFYDKMNKQWVTQIEVEYWGNVWGPLAGAGGKKFYIYQHVLFFETTDWVS